MDIEKLLKPDYIKTYKSHHKRIYQNFKQMYYHIFMISEIHRIYKINDSMNRRYNLFNRDIITKNLYTDQLSLLILKAFKTFFDNDKKDTIILSKFKNRIITNYVNEQAKSYIQERINETDFKSLQNIEENIRKYRNKIVAHNVDYEEIPFEDIKLNDLFHMLEVFAKRFQALSFDPQYKDLTKPMFDSYIESIKPQITQLLIANVINSDCIEKIHVDYKDEKLIDDQLLECGHIETVRVLHKDTAAVENVRAVIAEINAKVSHDI